MKKKKHILEDKKFHVYHWVFNGKKTTLYVDGKVFKENMPMTVEFWFKGNNKGTSVFDELRVSKCARRKLWTGLKT